MPICMQSAIKSVRLSVRHMLILYRNECTYRQTFTPSGRGTTLGFSSANASAKLHGNPFSRRVKYTGWENYEIFGRYGRLSLKWYEISPWLL